MAVTYSKQMMIERINKHLNDGWPGYDWKITDNEMLLYIDTNIPFVLKGQMFEGAKVSGVLDLPEAYIVTYTLTISNQNAAGEWYATLPQAPLALPTGYDISDLYLIDPVEGKSRSGFPVKAKRQGYRDYMPKPSGFLYRFEGDTLFLKATDGTSLFGYSANVAMPVSRTENLTDPLRIPDDAIAPLTNMAIQSILQRYQIPQDIVLDNLAPGNKSS